ncbi:uncharacterized protein LOC106072547 [Biomphalaria glabrata]|uniref:Uncharacterized protein LOC106072547 n=1 Tax=Biomphalaria glabrata TaxID=6526 RepID=A0A9U8EIA6_BIOGL|nr:uncharacterized protein LOC106072547 [Biomphalaria glabrata]
MAESSETGDDGSKTWNRQNTFLLIDVYNLHKEKFQEPFTKKKDIWDTISQELKAKGHHLSGEKCDKKFRDLKRRYKTIMCRNVLSGKLVDGSNKWIYFDKMDALARKGSTMTYQASSCSLSDESPGSMSSPVTISAQSHVPSISELSRRSENDLSCKSESDSLSDLDINFESTPRKKFKKSTDDHDDHSYHNDHSYHDDPDDHSLQQLLEAMLEQSKKETEILSKLSEENAKMLERLETIHKERLKVESTKAEAMLTFNALFKNFLQKNVNK